jgi:hypothetical protein
MRTLTASTWWCIHPVGARKHVHTRVQCRGRPKTFDRRRTSGGVIRAQGDGEGEPVKMDFSLLQVRV